MQIMKTHRVRLSTRLSPWHLSALGVGLVLAGLTVSVSGCLGTDPDGFALLDDGYHTAQAGLTQVQEGARLYLDAGDVDAGVASMTEGVAAMDRGASTMHSGFKDTESMMMGGCGEGHAEVMAGLDGELERAHAALESMTDPTSPEAAKGAEMLRELATEMDAELGRLADTMGCMGHDPDAHHTDTTDGREGGM